RYPRYTVRANSLRVWWQDGSGGMKMARARVLNISEGGIGLELPEAAMARSIIRFESDRDEFTGTGRVRHCHRRGPTDRVGLEFSEGTRWRSPGQDVQEPIGL